MSNRQQRNRKKARRRREKILGSFPDVRGFRIYADVFDYGCSMRVSAFRQADGVEFGVLMTVDRLWRHMESMPQRLVYHLLDGFDSFPSKERMVYRLPDGFAALTPEDC